MCSSEGRLQLWATWVHPIGSAVGWERAGLSKLVWKEPHSKFCQGCGPLNSSSPCSTNIITGSMYHVATNGFPIKLSFFKFFYVFIIFFYFPTVQQECQTFFILASEGLDLARELLFANSCLGGVASDGNAISTYPSVCH